MSALTILGTTAAALAGVLGGEAALAQTMLYQRLRVDSVVAQPTVLAVDLSPQAWRVGGPDGPAASEAQLRSVLGSLAGIAVADRCNDVRGRALDCSVALPAPDYAGIVLRDGARGAQVIGWVATGAANPAPRFDTTRYLGLLAPQRWLGSAVASQGLGMAWRYRVALGASLPPGFDLARASLVLVGGEPRVPLAGVLASKPAAAECRGADC